MRGDEDVHGGPGSGSRVSRRSMIKRSAAAGVVAWTAPVILDSFASPAAAATAATGTNYLKIICTPDNSSCLPIGYGVGSVLPTGCISGTCRGGLATTFTISGGCSCTFTAAKAARSAGSSCENGTRVSPTQWRFPAQNGNTVYNWFAFVLTCS